VRDSSASVDARNIAAAGGRFNFAASLFSTATRHNLDRSGQRARLPA
jgi:hypothetical protein